MAWSKAPDINETLVTFSIHYLDSPLPIRRRCQDILWYSNKGRIPRIPLWSCRGWLDVLGIHMRAGPPSQDWLPRTRRRKLGRTYEPIGSYDLLDTLVDTCEVVYYFSRYYSRYNHCLFISTVIERERHNNYFYFQFILLILCYSLTIYYFFL